MRAVALRNHELSVEEFPELVPKPGMVKVRTVACGICGSDLHFRHHGQTMTQLLADGGLFSNIDFSLPIVMGHEFVATVEDLGPDPMAAVQVGDLVVSVPVMLTAFPPSPDTTKTIGYSNVFNGGYAESMLLSGPMLLKVPNGLAAEHAALTEPMAVGLHAVRSSGIVVGDAAVVHGCGPVGLAVIAALRLLGIERIIAADFSPARRALATTMGATETVDPAAVSALDVWAASAPPPVLGRANYAAGSGAGLVQFECVGVRGMLHETMRRAPRSSMITVVGVCMESDTIQPIFGINKELRLQFVLGYTAEEFAETLHDLAEGRTQVAPLITGRVGLDGVAQAFEDLAEPERHAKILVIP